MIRRKWAVFFFLVWATWTGCPLGADQPITILSPQRGEILKSGEQREIKWQADSEMTSINILYLVDEGEQEIGIIAEGVPNNGSFVWQVPQRQALVQLIIKGYNAQGVLQTKAFSEPFEITSTIDNQARSISIQKQTKVAEVDISEQRLRVYDSGVLIFQSLLSTGRGGSTPKGIFTVYNKGDSDGLCSAWSNRYHCFMPYWVGLDGVPNKPPGRHGIHGPPYTKTRNGRKFKETPWGRPASKGCIRQFWDPKNPDSPNKAKEFFELAYIGMTVVIQE